MTTTRTRPPTPPPVLPRRGVADRLREMVSGTPGRLRTLGIGTAVVAVVFSALSFLAVGERSNEIGDVRADAAQLVRLQSARTSLVAAHAAATNAFLVGGLEPSITREAYEAGIGGGAEALAAASVAAEPRDTEPLAVVTQALVRYTGLIESARANNRQGFPVGGAYLRQATAELDDEIRPGLDTISTAVEGRIDDSYDSSGIAGSVLWGIGLVAVLALVASQVALMRRTRRWLSVPLVVALVAVAVSTIASGALMGFAASRADDVRDGPYARSVGLANARSDAFDAKSAESLTLIYRGSGQAFEDRFVEATESAMTAVPRGAVQIRAQLSDYLEVHNEIRTLDDDDGNWEAAVQLAISDDADTGANGTFAAFDQSSGRLLSEEADRVDDDLRSARRPLGFVRLLLLAAGLLAALAGWQAFAVRLREYR